MVYVEFQLKNTIFIQNLLQVLIITENTNLY